MNKRSMASVASDPSYGLLFFRECRFETTQLGYLTLQISFLNRKVLLKSKDECGYKEAKSPKGNGDILITKHRNIFQLIVNCLHRSARRQIFGLSLGHDCQRKFSQET